MFSLCLMVKESHSEKSFRDQMTWKISYMEILAESLLGRWKQQVQRPKRRKNLAHRRKGEEW